MKTLITTKPFSADTICLETIEASGNRKLTKSEHYQNLKIHNPDFIIAGTETYSAKELDLCPNLKAISRVGVGISSIDQNECKRRGIKIFNTPDAPSNSVAEFTVASILNMVKKLYLQDASCWRKVLSRDISSMNIGIVGYGKIGRKVEKMLKALKPKSCVICDPFYENSYLCLSTLFKCCDIITFHIPGLDTPLNLTDFSQMKKDVIIVNTSRGAIFNEEDLYEFLKNNREASASLDVFREEPTSNKSLISLPNVFATPHVASFSDVSRARMEAEAVNNIVSNFYI